MSRMANIWLSCLIILACFCLGIIGGKPIGFNVVSAAEFREEISSKSELLRVAYFATGESQGHVATAFKKNFKEVGEYLKNFKIKFMTVDCKKDPVKEYCDKPRVNTMVFVFREDYVMDEMPMDILYSVDSIIANVLHLALLSEVPTVQTSLELSAVKQRVKGKKDVIFAKLIAIGTPDGLTYLDTCYMISEADRAFMEGAFAYSNRFQFVMTTNQADNLLGTSNSYEWDEEVNRVWYYDCIHADRLADCERVIYHGPMTVHNFATFLKTLNLPLLYEKSNVEEEVFNKPLHETFGVPVAYLVTTTKDYDNHKEILMKVANTYKGNLVFAINTSDPGVALKDICLRPPPCMIIQPPEDRQPLSLHRPYNFVNVDKLVVDWFKDYYFDPNADQDEPEEFFGEELPDQERQDDSVALAVEDIKPHKLKLTETPALTDKTFQKFLDDNSVAIITFTIRWDPRSMVFLQPYNDAAKRLIKDLSLDHSPLGRVECSNWPDVCEKNNVTAYPTIKIYRYSRFVMDYKGILNTTGILKAYYLHSMPNPMKLKDSMAVESFKHGRLLKWCGELLQSVTVAVIPSMLEMDNVIYEKVGQYFRGEHLLGICTEDCAKDAQVNTISYVFVSKWNDVYHPEVNFKEEITFSDLVQFIEKASLPTLILDDVHRPSYGDRAYVVVASPVSALFLWLRPELTPASLPKYFWKGLPFVILFRVPGEDSDRIERVLARLTEFEEEDRVVMTWMDASPHSVGSHLLHNYKFKDVTPPNLVFLDHSTSRVCNYPDIELIKSEDDLFASIMQWKLDMLRQEGNCNVLESGHYEPQVPGYDFLALIKEDRMMQREQARGRFGTKQEFEAREGEETESDSSEEKEVMSKMEDEMFGVMEEKDGEGVDMKQHGHVEL